MKMPYLWSDKDRHGNVRYYVARPGQRKIRVRGVPGTAEFIASYNAAFGAPEPASEPAREPRAPVREGSLRAACIAYKRSAAWRKLGPTTQRARRGVMDRMCDERFEGDSVCHGDKPFATMPAKAIRRMLDAISDRPEAANDRLKALRALYAFAIDHEWGNVTVNLARDVKKLESDNPGGFHAWTIDEVRQYEAAHPPGSMARRALALLLYTGQRRSDMFALGRQHVRDGWITLTQIKGRKKRVVTLSIPIIPALAEELAHVPPGQMTFLHSEWDRPFASSNAFGNKFRDWCDEAGLPQCSAHGLRKACSARLAELGCTEKEIMAITGHLTMKEVQRYTASARQKVLAKAAMRKMAGRKRPTRGEP